MMFSRERSYKFRNAARVGTGRLNGYLDFIRLQQLKIALCILHGRDMIVVCYIDNLLIFAERKMDTKKLKAQLKSKLVLKE